MIFANWQKYLMFTYFEITMQLQNNLKTENNSRKINYGISFVKLKVTEIYSLTSSKKYNVEMVKLRTLLLFYINIDKSGTYTLRD